MAAAATTPINVDDQIPNMICVAIKPILEFFCVYRGKLEMLKQFTISIFLMAAAGSAGAATCTGACGALGADGVVTAPPTGPTYNYVTTDGGVSGAGQISSV